MAVEMPETFLTYTPLKHRTMTEFKDIHSRQLQLLSDDELNLRLNRVRAGLVALGADSVLITDAANIYYLTGRVFAGYVYFNIADSKPYYIVRRPNDLISDRSSRLGRFAEIADILCHNQNCTAPERLGLEFDIISYNLSTRLMNTIAGTEFADASGVMRRARSVKTCLEQQLMKESGLRHEHVYSRIPHVYQAGMTDIELQVEIERQSRLEGNLGIFRISGSDMEIHMGNVITGENSDTPTPYDFAMGGAGLNPSLPVGADGSLIEPHHTVMVDVNGDFTGYMTDMTRCFALGTLDSKTLGAHQLSIDIVHALTDMARPGAAARELYEKATMMAKEAGYTDYFMGHRQHAGFVGHGLGIEINEGPVISPRSKDILEAGNAIALEPKFVIPGQGAAGIENTIIVKEEGAAECITNAPEQIIYFE